MDENLAGLKHFKEDKILSEFLDEDFNVQNFTTNIIENTNIQHRLAELENGICILDKELQYQIAERHGDLLAQATGIESLEGVLITMQNRITSIQSAVERVRNKVGEPYNKIQSRTTQLRRLQNTCDALRRIIRLQRISKRLRVQLNSGVKEITKAAQSLRELEHLSEGIDLHGIEVFDENQIFFHQAKEEVLLHAKRILDQGLRSLNQTHTATALQVFYNLGCLQTPIQTSESETIKHINKCIQNALSNISNVVSNNHGSFSKSPGKLSTSLSTTSAIFRNNLWSNLENLVEQVSSSLLQLFHLQQVLLKKRDPVTHVIFANEITKSTKESFLQSVWKETCKSLQQNFEKNSVLKSVLESEFPKLIKLLLDLWMKIEPHQHLMLIKSEDEYSEEDFNAKDYLMNSVKSFERSFLQKSLLRLFDPINLLFPSGGRSPPSTNELETVLKTINNELNISNIDPSLCVAVSRSVGKTIQLFAARCEQMLATQGEASQVIGPATSVQTRNVAIINLLIIFQTGITKILVSIGEKLEPAAINIIQAAVEHLSMLTLSAVQPLVESVSSSVEAIILTMHDENFNSDDEEDGVISSLYMKELRDFLARVVKDHFNGFVAQKFVLKVLKPVGNRCLSLFIRHSSLVSPLSENGKKKLSADFNQLEQALNPLCNRLTDFGTNYRRLRSFKSLLFQCDEAISESSSLGEVISYSLSIQILISRTCGEIRSPYQVMNWSIAKYSRWLDEHWSEQERLNMIRGAIENHVQLVRSQNKDSFALVYPLLLKMLKRGIESFDNKN